jgi:PAS domain-containing protein
MNYLKTKTLPGHEAQNGLFNHALALLLLCLMVALELATRVTICNLASILCFGIFSQRMRPEAVTGWVVLFSLTSLYFLLQDGSQGTPADLATVFVRFATVILGGIGAVVLSFDRNRIAEGFLQTIRILDKLPTPVIISDNEGSVIFMNHDALQLLDTTSDAVRGASYFSFVAGEEKGRTIQSYFEFVDSHQMAPHDVILQVKKPKPMSTQATLVAIEGQSGKLVATVFPPMHRMPAASHEKAAGVPQNS